jgi:hypothetical protein
MQAQIDRWKANATGAKSEELLDRVTVLRAGMEAEALEVIEDELRSRGVTDEQVEKHRLFWVVPVFPRWVPSCREHCSR